MIVLALFSVSGSFAACSNTSDDEPDPSGAGKTGGVSSLAGASAAGEHATAGVVASAGTGSVGAGGRGGLSGAEGGISGARNDARGASGGAPVAGGSSRGGASGEEPVGGASSGGTASGTGGEYVDSDGRCRAQTAPYTSCPERYGEPLPEGPCEPCEGVCGGVRVQMRLCSPTQGCAYDLGNGELVGMLFGDDVKVHCDGDSYNVISGDWPYVPGGCYLDATTPGGHCPLGSIPL